MVKHTGCDEMAFDDSGKWFGFITAGIAVLFIYTRITSKSVLVDDKEIVSKEEVKEEEKQEEVKVQRKGKSETKEKSFFQILDVYASVGHDGMKISNNGQQNIYQGNERNQENKLYTPSYTPVRRLSGLQESSYTGSNKYTSTSKFQDSSKFGSEKKSNKNQSNATNQRLFASNPTTPFSKPFLSPFSTSIPVDNPRNRSGSVNLSQKVPPQFIDLHSAHQEMKNRLEFSPTFKSPNYSVNHELIK